MSELILWPSVGYVGYQNNTVGSEGDPLSLVMTSLANSETLTEKLTFEQVHLLCFRVFDLMNTP